MITAMDDASALHEDGCEQTAALLDHTGLAGDVPRRWGVDSTENHSLNPSPHHLWLRNPPTLYGVESASLAPGRSNGDRKGQL